MDKGIEDYQNENRDGRMDYTDPEVAHPVLSYIYVKGGKEIIEKECQEEDDQAKLPECPSPEIEWVGCIQYFIQRDFHEGPFEIQLNDTIS